MMKVREFDFSTNRVVVTFDDGSVEVAQFRRYASGAVYLGGQYVGYAAIPADVQLLIREFFVDEYEHM